MTELIQEQGPEFISALATNNALSLLPPLVAILLALWKKNALLALIAGLLTTELLVVNGQIFTAIIASITDVALVFSSINNLYIILFSLFIGALVTLMDKSGAVNGFIKQLSTLNIVRNKRSAALLPTAIGCAIFTDTNLSIFTAGTLGQKLFDTYHLSRAKLAYLIDSTCAPVSILLLINGWGAYLLGLLTSAKVIDTVSVLIGTIQYNFYPMLAIALALYSAYSNKYFGPLKHQENSEQTAPRLQPQTENEDINNTNTNTNTNEINPTSVSSPSIKTQNTTLAAVMWLPLAYLISSTLVLLLLTGDGDIRNGAGAFSVFYSIIGGLILLILMIIKQQLLTKAEIIIYSRQGLIKMLIPVIILILSFAFGDSLKTLGTGAYVSQLINLQITIALIAPILFIAAGLIAFSTGTSWGTFAILVPIAVTIGVESPLPIEFLVAAVLGGGVFGDHASPISDTTVIASLASGCDHYQHVSTQLPYALLCATISLLLYTLIGLTF
ncbi:MAG: Na+/H+ antiporter NhaC family protein [Thalassotalea sp.]